jgi:endonuclease-3
MAAETAAIKARVKKIIKALTGAYPDAHCTLNHKSPFELLVATVLAAQCTDKRVNMVTPALFEKYPGPKAFAEADIDELEDAIRSTGFFRNKAKSIKACAVTLVEQHGSKVPDTMEELTALAGVGRKTANVILGNAFDTPGMVVDTHVRRLSQRIGLTTNTDPDKIELDLMPTVPRKSWTLFSHMLVFHGRNVCIARAPRCPDCVISKWCDYPNKST